VKLRDERLRDALAAEYAVGTLQGRARRRFERALQSDPALRRAVVAWQDRLSPLNDTIETVAPPARVWRKIERALNPGRRGARLWESLGFWRGAAFASSLAALVLAVWLALLVPGAHQKEMMVVVMADDQSRPALTVSWDTTARAAQRLRVRVIGHQTMAPDTAWELWLLPGGDQNPVSLGLITTHETQTVDVPANLVRAVNAAWGMAMSVEPKGGSPTGLPSGPVLYRGPCLRL
jgi:anti-sigma-K factor RskA